MRRFYWTGIAMSLAVTGMLVKIAVASAGWWNVNRFE